ncbi:MAG TPA: helix-turn-helix transcriptional regulator [Clostridia bacterium]|nr:helix-turn-helix transcriptional regulator [Clostridia bacterium]
MNPNELFGKRVYGLRKEQDMTQEDLAQRLGVTNQSVSKWELGQCYPDIALLPALAEIFKVTTDELLGVAAPDAPDRLARQIRAVFAGTPKEEVFELAVRLAGKMHEGVCTLGYREKVPWQIRGELGGLEWGFSARVEAEGATARRDRTVFFSAQGGKRPSANDLRKLAQTLAALGDRAVLTVLYALDERQPQTKEDLLAQGLTPEELQKAISTLPVEETEEGLALIGCYRHVPQLLGMLFEMRGMLF